MRYVILVLLSGCASSLDQRCWYEARARANDANYDKSAKWCRTDNGVEKCYTPGADDFYRECMEKRPPRSR